MILLRFLQKKLVVLYAFFLGISLIFLGCGSKQKTLPGYSGSVGEIVVVIEPRHWNGEAGKAVREVLAGFQFGLPQDEPLFTVINIPFKAFTNVFQIHRNVLVCDIGKNREDIGNTFESKKNQWANGQLVITLQAKDERDFSSLLLEKSATVLQHYQTMEMNRLISRNLQQGNVSARNQLRDSMGIDLVLQKEMDWLSGVKDDFVWLQLIRERPVGGYQHSIIQGLVVKYSENGFDSLQLNKGLSEAIGEIVIGEHNSFMEVSEKYVLPSHHQISFHGNAAVESRGLWRMQHGFMGGPFYAIRFFSSKLNKYVLLYGFVYAPQFPKREYLREIEAMIWSFQEWVNPS